jgi:hypothetical protein
MDLNLRGNTGYIKIYLCLPEKNSSKEQISSLIGTGKIKEAEASGNSTKEPDASPPER